MQIVKKAKKRIIFLCSSKGTNFRAVMESIKSGEIRGIAAAVITDNPGAGALQVADEFKLKKIIVPFRNYLPDKERFHSELLINAEAENPDLIVTAGYLRILNSEFIKKFRNRIINIHPSLLPSFPGLNSQKQAFDYGVKVTGCTSHFVEEGMDSGPVILQSVVKIKDNMTERDLTLSILKEEHKILPLTVKYFCEDRLKLEGRKVVIKI